MCFKKAQLLADDEIHDLCQIIIDDLHEAAEGDGIGMESDSEWIYLDYAEQLEEY